MILLSAQIQIHGRAYRIDLAEADVFARWAGTIISDLQTPGARAEITILSVYDTERP